MSPDQDARRTALAYLQVVLAGSLWATAGPLSTALYRMEVPADSVAFLRPAMGTVILALFLVWMRGGRAFHLSWRGFLHLLLAGGVIVAIFQFAYQMSTEAVGVAATVALLYLAPAFVVGMSAVLFRERLTPARVSLALLSVVGVWLTVFGARGVEVDLGLRGILWGCVSGLSYGCYTLFGKHFGKEHGSLGPLFWSTLGGTLMLGMVRGAQGESIVLPPSALAWFILFLLGLLTMALAALFLFNAMRTLEAGRASIGTTVEPLMAALLALVFLDQTLTPWGWLGLVVLMIGVAGAYAAGPTRRPPTSPVG